MSQTHVMAVDSSDLDGFRTSVRVSSGVAMVTLSGRLKRSVMPTCRTTLDAILRVRAPQIVLDLSDAQLDDESIAMLTWMHRYVGHFGVTLTLTGVSRVVTEILEQDHLDSVFRVRPTNHAQRRATARAEHRNQWPKASHPSTPHSARQHGPQGADG